MFASSRSAYVNANVETASPAKLLVMLLDRLVLDVKRAAVAQRDGNRQEKHNQLLHAQAIVAELQSSLDPKGFRGAEDLSSLYAYLHKRLVEANLQRSDATMKECLMLSSGLADTWRTAAEIAAGQTAKSA